MSDSTFFIAGFWIKAGSPQVVAIACVDIEAVEFMAMLKSIRQAPVADPAQYPIDGFEVGKTPFAFQGFEKVAGIIKLFSFQAVVLKEFVTASRAAYASQDP